MDSNRIDELKKANENINFTFTTSGIQELQGLIQKIVQENIKQKPLGKLYNRHQAADYFDVSPITIDRWRKTGKLKDYKIGGKVRFKKSDLIEAANKN